VCVNHESITEEGTTVTSSLIKVVTYKMGNWAFLKARGVVPLATPISTEASIGGVA
jgi:hypothetical protein